MKLILLLLTLTSFAFAARESVIDADCLRIKDGTCINKTELGNLSGVSSGVQAQLDDKADAAYFQGQIDDRASIDGDETLSGRKTINGKIIINSTTEASLPCPVMTGAQRDAITAPSAVLGECIINSTTNSMNIYNGTSWQAAGGGLSAWITSFPYALNDIVIESNNIYQCISAHTSGTFVTDLAATKWLRVSTDVSGATGLLPLANGGTNKNATASNGAIAYSDADSFELLAPGIPGQVLQTNGASAPSFVYPNIGAKAENTASYFMEELQVSNNQLTETDTNKHLISTCGDANNLLANCGFEHSTYNTSWTFTGDTTTRTKETTKIHGGKNSIKFVASTQTVSMFQNTSLYGDAFTDGVQGIAIMRVWSSSADVYLCASDSSGNLVATSDGTKITNCAKHSGDSKWGLLKLPVIFGSANGIRLVSLNATTGALMNIVGTIYADEATLSVMDELSEINGTRKVGSIRFTGCSGNWSNGSTTYATLGTNTCTVTTTGGIAAATTSVPGFRILGRAPGTYKFDAYGRFGKTVSTTNSVVGFAFRDVTNSTTSYENLSEGTVSSGIAYSFPSIGGSLSYSTTGDTSYEIFGKTSTTTSSTLVAIFGSGYELSIDVYYYPPSNTSVYTSQCGANCVDEFSARIGTSGSVTVDDLDIINGNCTLSGTSNETKTCTFNSGKFTVAPSITATSCSSGSVPDRNVSISTLSSTGFSFTTRNLVNTPGDSEACFSINKTGADFVATRTIVGSFSEVNTSPGISKPKTCHYAFGGASATLAAPTVCSTGTCVEVLDTCNAGSAPTYGGSAGYYLNVTFASGTWANSTYVDCRCKSWTATAGAVNDCDMQFETSDNTWSSNSNGGYVGNTYSTNQSGTPANAYVSVICTGNSP